MVGGFGRFLLTLESPRILKKKTFTPFCFSSKFLDLSFLCAVFDFSAFWLPGPLASCTHASPTWPRTDIVPSQWPRDAALTLAWYSLGLLTSLTTPFWKLFGSLDFAYFFLVFLLPFWPFLLNAPPPNSVLVPPESFSDSLLPLVNFSHSFVFSCPHYFLYTASNSLWRKENINFQKDLHTPSTTANKTNKPLVLTYPKRVF